VFFNQVIVRPKLLPILLTQTGCICIVDGEFFTPLVFATFGGLGKDAIIFTIAWLIYYHRSTTPVTTRHSPKCLVRCPSIALLRFTILTIRESRSASQ